MPIFFINMPPRNTPTIEKINAGASLIQLYTGFIYEGPGLIRKINRAILNHASK